ncbi:MAG: hypothetical protein R3C68_12050 [Myxococcota bacterium]
MWQELACQVPGGCGSRSGMATQHGKSKYDWLMHCLENNLKIIDEDFEDFVDEDDTESDDRSPRQRAEDEIESWLEKLTDEQVQQPKLLIPLPPPASSWFIA